MSNKDIVVGFVSAQQIYNDVDVQQFDEITNTYTGIKSDDLFLSRELFLWRCEQYKKYSEKFRGLRCDDCKNENLFKLWKKSKYTYFDEWLFDFVMSGKMDEEMKK